MVIATEGHVMVILSHISMCLAEKLTLGKFINKNFCGPQFGFKDLSE